MTAPHLQLELTFLTHAGSKRANNEDCVAIDTRHWQENMSQPHCLIQSLDRPHCLLVADGLGGHPAGDIASRFAAEYLGRWISSCNTVDKNSLASELQALNRYLFDRASATSRQGMGCTIAGIITDLEKLLIFNVGDAIVFRENNGFLAQVSVSDSPIVSFGEPDRNIDCSTVTQCLGGTLRFQEIEPHVHEQRLIAGRCYLIATDGLTAALKLETIEVILKMKTSHRDALQHILHTALASIAPDNLSIILLSITATVSNRKNRV